MARHKKHERRKHRVPHPRCAPAVIPVSRRFKRRFERAEKNRLGQGE